jgi:hypothetical protein
MASGMSGKPPPEPTSRTLAFGDASEVHDFIFFKQERVKLANLLKLLIIHGKPKCFGVSEKGLSLLCVG